MPTRCTVIQTTPVAEASVASLSADKGEAVHKSPLQDDEHGMYLMAVMRVGCIDIVDALVGPQGHRGAVPYPDAVGARPDVHRVGATDRVHQSWT